MATQFGWESHLASTLARLDGATRRRVLREIGSAQGPMVRIDQREVVLCCANDYLGLACDPRLKAAAIGAIEQWGTSAGASRLISGSMTPHHRLEQTIADWKQADAALLFNSGYHANVGVLSALLGPDDIVYSDALNHASLIDGCRLSRAAVRIYAHADMADLARLLEADRHGAGNKLIVTDTVFSMDADEAPLAEICDLAERYDAWVMVDEAHAAGVLGPEGAGLVADLGLQSRVAVQMGTLGKALGSFGAYVAGMQQLIDVLVNRARSFVFTTALPPAVAATSECAVQIVRRDDALRARAVKTGQTLRESLSGLGWKVLAGRVPIVPVIVGGDAETMALADQLLERDVLAVGIRPPTVPEGTSRIRLTVGAAHTDAHLAQIMAGFAGTRA